MVRLRRSRGDEVIFCTTHSGSRCRITSAWAYRPRSLFFWRDRSREVDFAVEAGGKLELFEAKWTEFPDPSDAINLEFVRNAIGKSRAGSGSVVCRTANSFPISNGFRAFSVDDLG
jgi:uncharacterized protein